MNIYINRETLLGPLQLISGVVERRQALPILANVLVRMENGRLQFTATDMEVELSAALDGIKGEDGEITIPARKFIDIVKALQNDADIQLMTADSQVKIKSGRSRFSLGTLPASDFPQADPVPAVRAIRLKASELKRLITKTQFAMAQQDVRYYLNGLLLETEGTRVRAVATDGHRLAVCEAAGSDDAGDDNYQIIVPRKAIQELVRMLGDSQETIELTVGKLALQAQVGSIRLTSKLVDGRFPDYTRVIPDEAVSVNKALADRELLRQGLQRAAILSNEKYRAVRLGLGKGLLTIMAHNPEQEQAEEEIEVEYDGEELEIGFNVTYLIDALNAIGTETVEIALSDSNSSSLLRAPEETDCQYVIMPMRL